MKIIPTKHLFHFSCLLVFCRLLLLELALAQNTTATATIPVSVGVVLDMHMWVGKLGVSCVVVVDRGHEISEKSRTSQLSEVHNLGRPEPLPAFSYLDLIEEQRARSNSSSSPLFPLHSSSVCTQIPHEKYLRWLTRIALPSSTPIPTPFNTNIIQEPYPSRFRMPQFETYDGTKDPDDHLHAFCSVMQVKKASDALMCKIFPSTLRGNARTWYYNVQPNSISSYAELAASFTTKFSILEIGSFNQAVGLAAIIQGLKHERFRDSLIKHPLPRLMKLMKDLGSLFKPRNTPYPASQLQVKRSDLRRGEMTGRTRDSKPLITERVLVDTGSAPDIMYYHCFKSLGLDPTFLQKYDGPIYRFNNQPVPVEGILKLDVAFSLVAILKGNQEGARHCYMTSVSKPWRDKQVTNPEPAQFEVRTTQQVMGVELSDNKPEDEARAIPTEEVEEVQLDDNNPTNKTQIGTKLSSKERAELISFLKLNRDVFEWTSADMLGIPTSVAIHKLRTHPLKKPITQKRLWQRKAGNNQGRIKKSNGKWRMCIDYTNLNEACPNDCHPLLSIDKLVEAASGNERLSLLDGYSGYQLHMAPEDEVKTSFYAGDEIYCYIMMPFGLKNFGATNHKMVTIVFQAQIGRNLEVYVDDIGVKSLKILQKLECSSRLIKWAVELGEFQITFQQRLSIRAQALADFIVECTSSYESVDSEVELWTLYVDRSSSNRGSGAGAVLMGLGNFRSEHALKFNFEATNNMVKYEALLLGLRLAAKLKVRSLQVDSNSQLVVNQVNSTCEVTDPTLAKSLAVVSKIKSQFERFQLTKISRSENEHANSLSKLASNSSSGLRLVFIEVLAEPSFQRSKVMEVSTDPETPNWTDPIKAYLWDETVPNDKREEMKLRRKASRYTLVDGILYKRSYSLPFLRCLTPYEAKYALCEVHEGVCGNQIGARTLTHKKCQFFAHLTHQPAEELTTLVSPWPVAQWGIDLLGPFIKGAEGVTHLVVVVDYFTKWVEARLLSNLTSRKIEDFVFSSVMCRYGIPNQVVADNEPQFNYTSFKDFCSSYWIKLVFTSVYHPEANEMVESVNKAILEGIKLRLDQVKAKWADELNNVL
ncbi:hypothetical protein SLEP1_g1850 [Rubroshorea leprosula]|uniref:Integrase catalytic domain-containing protein n=1 Tax=Rubroshorea leprosula TaxID=152421 RepID=A0AAV5HNF3_9ROSI|nr:hypothetical protein SLEP1_g1850 [Rubroshorea leprosula]